MKEVVALCVLLAFGVGTARLAIGKKIGIALTVVFLAFSIFSGLAIANYDWIRKARWEVPDILGIREQIAEVGNQAVQGLNAEIEGRQGELGKLLSDLEEMGRRVDSQKKELESLLADAVKVSEAARGQEQAVKELNRQAEKAREQMASIHRASCDLALSLAKVTWLQMEAKDSSGTKRGEAAAQRTLDGLDEVVGLVLGDPDQRERFVAEVMDSLPPKK